MIRKSFSLLALALAAAAVAAPLALASSAPKVDPLAVSYLIGQGYTPSQVEAWTVGACSHEAKPAACFGPSKGTNLTGGGAKVDPLAVSYLIGQGLSPSEVASWTVGACSHETRAASCYAMFEPAAASTKVDPLAVSYLTGQGLSPSEVTSWTAGACSHEAKAASCFAMFQPAATSTQVVRSIGFQWGDAGIGAGAALGLVLLLGGAGAGLLISRQNRRRQMARA
jgi:hypothetical protein